MWKKPLLEFVIPVWNPYHKADIEILERVQHGATKIAHSMKSMSYEERCKHLNLTSLSDRRTRGDLIQKFKIENNFDEVEWQNNPVCGVPRVGHRDHFKREIVKSCDQRHNFFNNRIASNWNILPNEIKAATSVNGFQKKLDDHLNGNRSKLPQSVILC